LMDLCLLQNCPPMFSVLFFFSSSHWYSFDLPQLTQAPLTYVFLYVECLLV
jgi:hypothetical protein